MDKTFMYGDLIAFWLKKNFPDFSDEQIKKASLHIIETVNIAPTVLSLGVRAAILLSTLLLPLQICFRKPVIALIPGLKLINKVIRVFGMMHLLETEAGIEKGTNPVIDSPRIKSKPLQELDATYDVVIVGSGPAGATIAYEIAHKHGQSLRALMVEKGDNQNSAIMTQPVSQRILATYRHGGFYPTLGKQIVAMGVGSTLGGGSKINGALMWRAPKFVLDDWFRLELITADFLSRLEENYDHVEALMSVVQERETPNYDRDSIILRDASSALAIKTSIARRAISGCQKTNECPAGCPTLAKQSVDIKLLPKFLESGADLVLGTEALRIDADANQIVLQDGESARKISYKKLYLAAGATETPKLLRNSAILKHTRINLDLHLNLRVLVKFDERIDADRGTMFTHQVQEFMNRGFLIMPSNFNPYFLAATIAGFEDTLATDILQHYDRLGLFVLQVRINSKAKLQRFGRREYGFMLRLSDDDETLIKEGLQTMAKILFTGGAESIYLPNGDNKNEIKPNNVDLFINNLRVRKLDFASVHQMSSLPMGEIVDQQGRIAGLRNIHIVDGSVLPSSVVESPQMTIMAMAKTIHDSISYQEILPEDAMPSS
ncbi:MAG: GMC family oxidoreductase N-terminal domain-containing protein [Candidatus Azotimanducaceae bacterium]